MIIVMSWIVSRALVETAINYGSFLADEYCMQQGVTDRLIICVVLIMTVILKY